MRSKIIFSLIIPTINRTDELQRLFESLVNQTFIFFEVIIIDQNKDNRLLSLVENYENRINLIHIKSEVKGLSVNRNIGIKKSRGSIICFPDDDCVYPTELLHYVNDFFILNPNIQIFACNVKDDILNKVFPMSKNDSKMNRYNYFDKCISIGIFIRYLSLDDLVFDEKLGVGSKYGSAEESDFISNLLDLNYIGYYKCDTFVYHEFPSLIPDIKRYYNYSMGYGALMKKEITLRKKHIFIIKFIFDLMARCLFSLLPLKKRKYYLSSLKGRIKGFISYK